MKFSERLKHSWNAFLGRDAPLSETGYASYLRPDRPRVSIGNDRSMISAIYNRIASDVSAINIQHVRVDSNGRYIETIDSGLNNCLTLSANIDQTGRAFIQDTVISLLDEGCVAIVPVKTTMDPLKTNSYDIQELRTGKILEWYPNHVKVQLYNESTGLKQDVILPKETCAIIENPFYSTMNEPSSTMQRLIKKLAMLDAVDEQSSAGKLDLIVQLPYVIKSEARQEQAEKRRKQIEEQLKDSKYGIAYTDGTEHITQLNRSLENNLLQQIQYLTDLLYSQLGMPKEVFNGTADEKTMLSYNTRTIEPIISAICDEMKRKFLTKTARTRGQSIKFFTDPFKLVPVAQISEIADKFTRNEILSSNEIRQIIGFKPSDNPKADELRNKNLNESQQDSEGYDNQYDFDSGEYADYEDQEMNPDEQFYDEEEIQNEG
jgi:HK97 family phage portal protein